MTRRNATSLPGSHRGRLKRKEAPDISSIEDCGPDLFSLHRAITKEVATLEELTCAIEEAGSDEEQPISELCIEGIDRDSSADVPPEIAYEKVLPLLSQCMCAPALVMPEAGATRL